MCTWESVLSPTQVAESLQRQEGLTPRLMSASAQFEAETKQAGTSARDNILKELATGYDTYQELTNNLQEGTQVLAVFADFRFVID